MFYIIGMIEIKNTQVFGLERTIKASGNSFSVGEIDTLAPITDRDIKRASRLGGCQLPNQSHDSFLKGIIVQFDIKYPQYWTPESQRYHWFEIVMSASKMHRLVTEALQPVKQFREKFNEFVDEDVVQKVHWYAEQRDKADTPEMKHYWFMKALSNLPMGYELWETVSTNYLQLKTIYTQRHNHELREDWGTFCEWCLTLPKFTELTGCGREKENEALQV